MNQNAVAQELERYKLTANRIPNRSAYPKIVRADPDRFWMDVSTQGWANRCVPLRIANQAGWFILNDVEFEVTWDGSPKLSGIRFRYKDQPSCFAQSMFGFGIVTWTVPLLFRTEPGFNLLARGPSNMPKDGITALDGIIETDWLPYPFTMNWKITRPRKSIRFEKDEPICMIVPMRRGDLERFDPEIVNLTSDTELERSYTAWHEARLQKVRSSAPMRRASEPRPKAQGNYMRGEGVLQERAPEHQNKLELRQFVETEAAVLTPEISQVQPPSPDRQGFWARLTRRMSQLGETRDRRRT